MMLLKTLCKRITDDFQLKELLPLKLIFFVQASTLYVLYPYLTIHMREVGINVEETAIMSAVTPFVGIIMPPIAGLIADRIGNFRIILSLFSALGGGAALLLLLVPVGRINVQFPKRIVMDASCSGSAGDLIFSIHQKYPCETKLDSIIDAKLESCGYACETVLQNDSELVSILSSRDYTLSIFNARSNQNVSYAYKVTDLPEIVKPPDNLKEYRILHNNEFFQTSVRQLSERTFFFPAHEPELFSFTCQDAENTGDPKYSGNTNLTICGFEALSSQGLDSPEFNAEIRALKVLDVDKLEMRRKYLAEKIRWATRGFKMAKCENANSSNERVAVNVSMVNSTNNRTVYKLFEGCKRKCLLTAARNEICTNMNMEIEYNIRLTFWLYLVIRVFIGIIGGTAFAMFEGAVIAILREQKADYGLQRIYGSIGGMISSPLSGLLIDYASRGKSYTDFRPAFYLYAALKIASGFLMLMINLEFKAPASNVIGDFFTVMRNTEVVALFLACFVLGTAWGYIESFLFWLIQDLGGSRSLMGITITVGGIAGIPLLALSGPIISKIGHANVLFIGFLFYAIRLLGYSLIYDPWHCLIFEALESVTSSLSFTAAVTYAAKLSTTTTDSSIQGMLGGLYYGVGKGSGSLIGGYLMKAFGTRPTYQILSVVSLVTGLMYLLFNVTYLSKRPQIEGNDIVKKKPKNNLDQNGLEKGVGEQIDLADRKNNKEKIAQGNENEAYIKDEANDRIEAIKNARNLDKIEKISDEGPKNKTEKNFLEDTEKEVDEKPKIYNDGHNEVRQRHPQKGTDNAAFENDHCDVTIEKQPDDK